MGLYRNNGKEHGSDYSGFRVWGYTGLAFRVCVEEFRALGFGLGVQGLEKHVAAANACLHSEITQTRD